MFALDTANSPLDFAQIIASRFTVDGTRIYSLREVAARYAKLGDAERGLAVLNQARHDLDRLVRQQHHHNALELPGFAANYTALGRHDLARQVIDASIQTADGLRPRFAASMQGVTAVAALEIGEVDLCSELVEQVAEYVNGQKRFRLSIHDHFEELIPLFVKLGMDEEAHDLVQKFTGFQKANAFAELAMYSRGTVRETYLEEALRVARIKKSEYSQIRVAEVLGAGGDFCRAREVIAGIKQRHVWFEGLLTLAVQLAEAGRQEETVAVLEELATSKTTFFYYHGDQLTRVICLLLSDHADAVRKLLDRISAETDEERQEKDRFMRLTRLVGLAALDSKEEAEQMVDRILDARLSDLNRRERGWQNEEPECILFELLLSVADRGLRWDEKRGGKFQRIWRR